MVSAPDFPHIHHIKFAHQIVETSTNQRKFGPPNNELNLFAFGTFECRQNLIVVLYGLPIHSHQLISLDNH